MNFFPNLQIVLYMYPNPSTASVSLSAPAVPVSTTAETLTNSPSTSASTTQTSNSTSSPTVSQILQRILRPGAPSAQTSGDDPTNDTQFYVNLDALYPLTQNTNHPQGLSIEQIHDASELGVFQGPSMLCTVCQIACEEGTIVQTLQTCQHRFHPVCIQRWLLNNNSCPVCRTHLVTTST